jgi:hypothetical protein
MELLLGCLRRIILLLLPPLLRGSSSGILWHSQLLLKC